ncbi:hypothetical protein CGRA01v4_07511 [Colletotrichum graminicola]|nr:hypothetical protein CGRA01v4_07511 [Colletotrichum graminicola]
MFGKHKCSAQRQKHRAPGFVLKRRLVSRTAPLQGPCLPRFAEDNGRVREMR